MVFSPPSYRCKCLAGCQHKKWYNVEMTNWKRRSRGPPSRELIPVAAVLLLGLDGAQAAQAQAWAWAACGCGTSSLQVYPLALFSVFSVCAMAACRQPFFPKWREVVRTRTRYNDLDQCVNNVLLFAGLVQSAHCKSRLAPPLKTSYSLLYFTC